MPKVAGKTYSYDKAGKKKAKQAKRKIAKARMKKKN